MRLVKMTYQYSKVEPSVFLLLFLRMVGIYITEDFLGDKVDVQAEIETVKKRVAELMGEDISFVKDGTVKYDMELIILTDSIDLQQYFSTRRQGSERVIYVLGNNVDAKSLDENRIVRYIAPNMKFLQDIIKCMTTLGLADPDDTNDFLSAAKIYCDNKLMQITLGTRFFYRADNEELVRKYINNYNRIVKELKTNLQKYEKENQESRIYLQYALANMKYEVDLYCRRNHYKYLYEVESIINILKKTETILEGTGNGMLNSVRGLLGQVYYDLLEDYNEANKYYLLCCQGEDQANAYIFMLKGKLWQEYMGNYGKAIRYYLRSVVIFPEYYRVWYKIGLCYLRQKEYDMTQEAFNAVEKILEIRLDAGSIRSMEMEHLFLACSQSAEILLGQNKIQEAIEKYKLAERVWNRIGESTFVQLMLTDGNQDRKYFDNIIREKLDIRKIYQNLAVACQRCGRQTEAQEYMNKYIR